MKTTTTWDLTDLYTGSDDPNIEADFKKAETLIATLTSYRSKIKTLSEAELLTLIQTWEKLAFLFHKIDLYAHLLEATNVGVATITRFSKHIEERMVAYGQQILFIDVELAQLPPKQWDIYLKSPILKDYQLFLKNIYESGKHVLSEPEERIMLEKSQTSSQALGHLYDITTDTLLFEWEGKQITLAELATFMRNPDGAIRKKAAMTYHEGIKVNDKTTPALYNALVQDKKINDTLRKYSYPEEARFGHDNVDRETVESLLSVINTSHRVIDRYYTLKKKLLKTDTLYWWDRNAPLPKPTQKITRDKAKQLVISALHEFSPEMATIAQTMFEKEHIDWTPSPTKRAGAFCAFGGNSIYPYILLNYTNTIDDVMTLAHELGHAIHDVLAQQSNVFFQTHPSLAIAEVASTFCEFLVFDALIQADIPAHDKIALTMDFIEGNFSTVFRQATMFQFEQKIHAKRSKEGELSKEDIDTLWHETMKKPFADSIIYTDEHKNSWMHIPHIFETPFYVYSYAFAQLCSLSLIKEYKAKGSAFAPLYLKLLAAGGSLPPKENLQQAGLSMQSVGFWQAGIDVMEDYINELASLLLGETRS